VLRESFHVCLRWVKVKLCILLGWRFFWRNTHCFSLLSLSLGFSLFYRFRLFLFRLFTRLVRLFTWVVRLDTLVLGCFRSVLDRIAEAVLPKAREDRLLNLAHFLILFALIRFLRGCILVFHFNLCLLQGLIAFNFLSMNDFIIRLLSFIISCLQDTLKYYEGGIPFDFWGKLENYLISLA